MAKLQFDRTGFTLNGQDQFLISGEFHYFRVPTDDWKRRMELFKEAGGNCLATYVPWMIHEPEEGHIVFDDMPNRSLTRFLETAKEAGLVVVLRPGPYQYSELINDGLPTWLTAKYPELLARNIRGEIFCKSAVSYLHPLFLEKARRYFAAFADVVRPFADDPVVMLQTDNELSGIQIWNGSLDYHPLTMGIGTEDGRYPRFLREKYGTLEAVRKAYGIEASGWSEVLPAESQDRSDPAICRRMKDYYDFYCGTMAEYLRLLSDWLYEDGLTLPICHNSANPNMNGMFLETVKTMDKPFLLGSDHYYTLNSGWAQNNPTPQYAVHVFHSMETMRLMGMPPAVLEMPGGSPSDTPPILPEDLLACYMTNLAMGMKGVNYYIYTGGPNFPDTGATCRIYDYNAPVHANGTLNETYQSLKTFDSFLKDHAWMQRGKRRSSAAIGFEWDNLRAGNFDCTSQALSRSDSWEFARLGVIYTMMCSRLAPELISLDQELDLSRPLIVPAPSAMSKQAQQKLIDFVENGGQLLILGTLPETDQDLNPCTLLREYLGSPELKEPESRTCIVSCPPLEGVYGMTPIHRMETVPEGASVLATDRLGGGILGFSETHGNGTVLYLACKWKMTTFDQPLLLEILLEQLGAKPCVRASNRNIFTALLEDNDGHETALVLNLYSSPQKTKVTVYSREGIAQRLETLSLNPMEVRIIE